MRKITEIRYQVMYQLKPGEKYHTKTFHTYEQALNYTAKKEVVNNEITISIYTITITREVIYNNNFLKAITK